MEAGRWREPLLAALRGRIRHDLPTLGICFGFEMLAVAAGSELRRLTTTREGEFPLALRQEDPLLAGLSGAGTYESRSWGVFGQEGTHLAIGPEGDVVAARYAPRVVGVIFHPEAHLGPNTARVYGTVVPRYLASLR
ncbi:MAG: hypothetical protein EXR71_03810 [Myxococcales bacterium]|nr:hypothetical protein [Myxococcales bacterium]